MSNIWFKLFFINDAIVSYDFSMEQEERPHYPPPLKNVVKVVGPSKAKKVIINDYEWTKCSSRKFFLMIKL